MFLFVNDIVKYFVIILVMFMGVFFGFVVFNIM